MCEGVLAKYTAIRVNLPTGVTLTTYQIGQGRELLLLQD